jgi:hypothetical protein
VSQGNGPLVSKNLDDITELDKNIASAGNTIVHNNTQQTQQGLNIPLNLIIMFYF